ncbi:MAG: type II secretion system protein [Nitrospirae bacterium]|nr:type II secretion system protein [Magnetococcales bacterium]
MSFQTAHDDHHRTAGFSLLELSLVLIIITLLMGTVLRGENLMDEGRLHRLALDQAAVATAVQSYVRLYHFFPGDDPKARERWPGAINGDGDGRILLLSPEETQAWNHLILSHLFVPKSISNGYPQHILGGNFRLIHHAARLPGVTLCMEDLLSLQAMAFDNRHDDGDGREGRIRNPGPSLNTNDTAPWPIEGERVTICVAL